ncbi:hypothetical protein Tco_0230250, partial [Tanacetum coccineum]
TPASKSLQLSTNADLTPFVVAYLHNEEMGISIALEDAVELVVVRSGCSPSSPSDVVVAPSAGEKADGLVPSSTAHELAVANHSGILSHATRPRPNGFPLGNYSIAGQAFIGSMGKILLSE